MDHRPIPMWKSGAALVAMIALPFIAIAIWEAFFK